MEMWMLSKNAMHVTDGTQHVTWCMKLITKYDYRKSNQYTYKCLGHTYINVTRRKRIENCTLTEAVRKLVQCCFSTVSTIYVKTLNKIMIINC